MNFFLYPIFWVFLFFSSGIICSSFDEENSLFTLFIGLILIQIPLIILFHFKKIYHYRYLQSSLILICFFLFGYFLNSLELNYLGYHTTISENRDAKYLGKVEECNYTISGYSKVVLQTSSTFNEEHWDGLESRIFLIIHDPGRKIVSGEKIIVYTLLERIKRDPTPGAFDAEKYWYRKGIRYMGFVQNENFKKFKPTNIHSISWGLINLRKKLLTALDENLTGQAAALAKGFLLGDRSDIESEMLSKFSATGAMHILAVSGLHIGILVQLLTKFLSLFSRIISKKQAVVYALVLAWAYACLTGLSASVVRSVVMFSFLSLSTLTGRRYIDINSLFFSAIVILVWNPSFLFDVGFQLSYAAMFGIFILYPEFVKLITFKNKWLMLAYEGTMVGVAAQVTTFPFTLYYFHQFPNYFILTNLALMAFSFVILLVGCMMLVFYWLIPLKLFLSFILQKVFTFMIFIVTKISYLPYAVASGFELNWLQVVALYVFIILLMYFYFRKNNRFFLVTLILTFFQISFLIYSRYQHLTKEQLFILPGNQPLSVLRYQSSNYFIFAKSTNAQAPAKILKIARSFSVIYPGKTYFYNMHSIEKMESINSTFPLSVKNNFNFIEINYQNNIARMYKFNSPKNTSNSFNKAVNFYYPLRTLNQIAISSK